MDRKKEYASPPEEFSAPAAEFTAPPEEYAAGGSAPPGRSGRRRRALLAAAAVLALLPLYASLGRAAVPAAVPEKPPETTAAPITSVSAPSAAASTPSPAPLSTPTPTPTSAPTPTPTPEPAEPEVQAVYLSFSDTLEGELTFTGQERIAAVHVEVYDAQLDRTLEAYDVPAEAIAAGRYVLPTMETGKVYMKYRRDYDKTNGWPDPVLRVTWTDAAQTVAEFTEKNHYGLGLAARYSAGEVTVSTYESTAPVTMAYREDDPAAPGEIHVWITIDGRAVESGLARLAPREERSGGTVWYYGTVAAALPDWAGEHGLARVTIREYIEDYDRVWVMEKDVEY